MTYQAAQCIADVKDVGDEYQPNAKKVLSNLGGEFEVCTNESGE